MTTGYVSYTPVLISAEGAIYRRLNLDDGDIKLRVVETSCEERVALTIFARGSDHNCRK